MVATAVAATALALGAGTAAAVISDVHTIAGPSPAIAEIADVAMSEDGTGGIVYLQRVGGRDHVFAAQFRDGRWWPPRRVDVGQSFDSSWPRIGAGDGGRLVVTWVHEFGQDSDRMFSATLDPGATEFQQPVPVDLDVGEATATHPDLAMSRGGAAYLVYRVVTDTSPANPPGYLGAQVRLARYTGRLWSVLGTPIDRNQAMPVRRPTAANSPRVAIDLQGQGIVAWQEPGDDFVDRVWARRVFGTQVGIPLQVSPAEHAGRPLRGPADAFALDVSGFGQGAVAFRQQPGQGGPLTAPRAFVNVIPDVFAETAGAFVGARLADGGIRGGLGVPSVAVDPKGRYLTAFSSGPSALAAGGDEGAPGEVERLDGGVSAHAGEPLVDLAETGAAVAAWRESRGGAGVVAVVERRADGVDEPAALSTPVGGAIERLVMDGSGLGDAIVAWRQGGGAGAQIAAAVVDAPPDPFLVLLPNGWRRERRIPISWDPAPSAIGGVTYSVSVDDEPVVEGLRGVHARLDRDAIADGTHTIQVFAIDDAGQETGSRTGRLLVDRSPPRVALRRRGRRLTVRVAAGPRRAGSPLGAVRVSFGDGRRARVRRKARLARATRAYAAPGTYRIVVRARDRAGNRVVVRRKVRIR